MKKRSSKLDRIVSLASSEERRWGERAGKARIELEQQLARLGELNAYRSEYQEKARGSGKIRSAHIKDYQQFLQRLDAAVSSQQQIIRDSEQSYETVRKQWINKRRRLESLERVLERYRQSEAVVADRLEQKALDELKGKGDQFAPGQDD